MGFDNLSGLTAMTLAGSLAMERLVTIVKTYFPTWFAQPVVARPGESEFVVDKARRRRMITMTLLASVLTAWFVAEPYHDEKSATVCTTSLPLICRHVVYAKSAEPPSQAAIHWIVFALMISGGSAFWANIVSYASASKDVRAQEKVAGEARGSDSAVSSAVTPVRPALPPIPPPAGR